MLLFTVTSLTVVEPTKSQHFVPLVQRSECHTCISPPGTAVVNNFSIFTSAVPHIFLINRMKTAEKINFILLIFCQIYYH